MAKVKNKRVIGLTLDSTEMRAVELSGTRHQPRVVASGRVSLPEGLVANGQITDMPAAAELLRGLLKDKHFGKSPVILGVEGRGVLLRMAAFPRVPEDKMRNVVQYQAQQYIPVPVAELNLDYVECDEVKEAEHPTVNLLLVGAQKTYVDQLLELVQLAGLPILDVDAAILASVRAMESCAQPMQGTCLLASLDETSLGMTVLREDNTILMARSVTHSPRFLRLTEEFTNGGTTETLAELTMLLQRELQASLQYFGMRADAQVSSVALLGSYPKLDRLADALAKVSQLPVQVPAVYPQLSRDLDAVAYAGCISLAQQGLEE